MTPEVMAAELKRLHDEIAKLERKEYHLLDKWAVAVSPWTVGEVCMETSRWSKTPKIRVRVIEVSGQFDYDGETLLVHVLARPLNKDGSESQRRRTSWNWRPGQEVVK